MRRVTPPFWSVSCSPPGRSAHRTWPDQRKREPPRRKFRSTRADFGKMPAGLYMGEGVGRRDQLEGPRVRRSCAAARRGCSSSIRPARSSRNSARGSYGFSFAHAVRVDKDDNVWAVDEGTNVIQKFSPDGKLLMVLGKRPGSARAARADARRRPCIRRQPAVSFHRQTDIGWDPQGNIFVSDGYGDSRVVKFDKNGRFIKAVGTRGNGPLQFSTPHAIAVDAEGHRLRRRSRQLAGSSSSTTI